MTVLLRFRDLQARGIVRNWPHFKQLRAEHGFPPGRMLSPNTRVWTEAEIDAWIESRPVENPRKQGISTAEGRAKAIATKAAKRAKRKAKSDNTEMQDTTR